MTREERDAIRKWCDEAETGSMSLVIAIRIRNGCYTLLTALDQAEAERDRWKARAEALGRVLKKYGCFSCENRGLWDEVCVTCNGGGGNEEHWILDEAVLTGDSED